MSEALGAAVAVALSASAVAGAFASRMDASVVRRLPLRRSQASDGRVASIRSRILGRDARPAAVRLVGASMGVMLLLAPAPINIAGAAVGLAAAKAPDVILARRERLRLRRIDRDLPLLLDAMSSAALAGLPPQSALRLAAVVVDGPLAEEVRSTIHAVDLGARWRDQLDSLVARCPLRDLARAVGVMSRTDAVGASFAEGMMTLARQARDARRAKLAQRARTAPVKMLFPLVFLVLPAFLLLTVVPLLVATLDRIR